MGGGVGVAAMVALSFGALAGCGGDADGARTASDSTGPASTTVPVDARCADGAAALAFTGPSYEEGGDVFVLDAAGEVRPLSTDGGTYSPSFSPDGTEVAVSSIGDEGEVSDSFGPSHLELQVLSVDGTDARALGSTGFATDPAWSPDGSQIVFSRTPDGESAELPEIWIIGADGGGERRLVAPEAGFRDEEPAWSPDGGQVAFVRSRRDDAGEQGQLVVTDVEDGEVTATEVLLDDDGWLGDPAFSPDATRLAVSGILEDDEPGLLVVDVASGDLVASLPGISSPAWTPDGRLLAYGRAPGISDASGSWRVAELAPQDEGVAVGLPVPDVDAIGYLYDGYRVAAPRCDTGTGPLTADVEPVTTIDVTVPSTGAVVTVLGRASVASALDQVVGSGNWAPPVRSKLVEPSQLTGTAAEPVGGGAPTASPLFAPGDEPLVWVVCDESTCAVVAASTGSFLMGGGSLGEQFEQLGDLAPP
jgi:dipeptidyl aminopeptidase/acylaminoacyl peptidase